MMVLQCHDVFTNNYCPRGPFCAFAHFEHEMSINRNLPTDTNLGDILSNALPNTGPGCGAASVAAALGNSMQGGLVGPIGSKPGEIMNNGNSNGNGNPLGLLNNSSVCATNPLGITSNSNGIVDGMGGFLGGQLDLSDVIRNTCRSPPDPMQQQQSSNNHGGNGGVPFGAQSFASAVSSYSGVAAAAAISDNRSSSNNIMSNSNNSCVSVAAGMMNHHHQQHHHGGKFFDGKGSLIGPGNGNNGGSFDMVSNLMNGPVGSTWKTGNGTLGNPSLYDNIDNAFSLGFPMEQDRDYSLFPSAGLSKLNILNLSFKRT